MGPTTYTIQQLGLITSTAISNHILLAHKKVKSRSPKDNERIKFGSLLLDKANYLATDAHQYGIAGSGIETTVHAAPINPVVMPRAKGLAIN